MSDGKHTQFTVYEFQDSNQYANLETLLVRWHPVACITPAGSMPQCTWSDLVALVAVLLSLFVAPPHSSAHACLSLRRARCPQWSTARL